MSHDRTDGPSPDDDNVGQIRRWSAGVLEVAGPNGYRATVLCWPCFWALEPDMWTSKTFYEKLNPAVPYDKLPKLDDNLDTCWDPTNYKWPL